MHWRPFLPPASDEACPPESGHLVQLYEAESSLAQVVAGFISAGLRERAPVVVFATASHRRMFLDALASSDTDVGSSDVEGLVWVDAHTAPERMLVEGEPHPARFREVVGDALARSTRPRPGARIRAYGEMVDVLWSQGRRDTALRLEALWNDLRRDVPLQILCAYGMAGFDRWR